MTVSQLSTRSRTYPVRFFSLDHKQEPTQLPLQGQLSEWHFILSHQHLLNFRFELAIAFTKVSRNYSLLLSVYRDVL
jgi:hypothetical protein